MLDSRRVIEILHELGSSAMLGALFAHGALLGAATVSEPPAYAAIAVHPPFHDTGWVWIKALLGVSVLGARGHAGRDRGPARRRRAGARLRTSGRGSASCSS